MAIARPDRIGARGGGLRCFTVCSKGLEEDTEQRWDRLCLAFVGATGTGLRQEGGDPAGVSLGPSIPSGAVELCMGRGCDVSMGQCQMPKKVLIPAGIKCIRVRMNKVG